MVPIETVFWGLVIFFGLVGALRGWAREVLVFFSVIVARAVEDVLIRFIPVIGNSLVAMSQNDPTRWFYVRLMIFILVIFFGYASPTLSGNLGMRARREKFQDMLLGFFLGALNGIMMVGTVWGFLDVLEYKVWGIIPPKTPLAADLLKYMPLAWMRGGLLYVLLVTAFIFVIVVFV